MQLSTSYIYSLLCICIFVKLIDATNLFIVPSEPRSLEVVTLTSTSVTLQWMSPEYPNGVITRYAIHCDEMDIDDFGSDMSDNTLIATIEGLSPNTVYVLKMKAYTRVGPGPSVSVVIKTCKLVNNDVHYNFNCSDI